MLPVAVAGASMATIAMEESQMDSAVKALFDAIERDDYAGVAALLAGGMSAKTCDERDGYTALMVAARGGRNAILSLLLEHSADVNSRTNDGYTALHSAARKNQEETTVLLLKGGADIDAHADADEYEWSRAAYGETPLSCAVYTGHTDVARMLYMNGADIRLHEAVILDDKQAVARLIEEGAEPNGVDHLENRALYYAIWLKRDEIAQLLRASGATLSLYEAVHLTDIQFVRDILASGVDVNARFRHRASGALLEAVRTGAQDIVRLLLDHGAEPGMRDDYGRTALEAIPIGRIA